jgi:hypothetical protein
VAGVFLSKIYKGNRVKLKWKCAKAHTWEARPNNIKTGQWCPKCNISYFQEEKCRFVLERLTDFLFKKDRTILNGYELDGYNDEHKLAFEHHGLQHYHYTEFFHESVENFNERQNLDKEKEKELGNKKINLILIHYWIAERTTDENLVKYISEKLIEFSVPMITNTIIFNNFYKEHPKISELNQIANKKGGKLVSSFYTTSHSKVEWECKNGHLWWATPSSVKNGSWCARCAGLAKQSIKDMQILAEEMVGSVYLKNILMLLIRYYGNVKKVIYGGQHRIQ